MRRAKLIKMRLKRKSTKPSKNFLYFPEFLLLTGCKQEQSEMMKYLMHFQVHFGYLSQRAFWRG